VSTYTVPNVGAMGSTGLTAQQMNIIWQNLVLQCLGITPSSTADAIAYAKVRVDWPPPGQPGWKLHEDVAFLRAVEVPDFYNYAHEVQPATTEVSYSETTIYTRVWEIAFIFYGPNSFDRARQVKACLYQDFAHDILAASNLYLITTLGTPQRRPELFANQWWERVDFSVRLNEQVTDTLTKPTMASVEVIIQDADGIVGDITVELE
jgi:hypothetical protein